MTKKEYEYWKSNVSKLLEAERISIYLSKLLYINEVFPKKVDGISRTKDPELKYETLKTNYHSCDSIIDVSFVDDCIVIKERYKHYYVDFSDSTKIKKVLIGNIVENKFNRKQINRLDVYE